VAHFVEHETKQKQSKSPRQIHRVVLFKVGCSWQKAPQTLFVQKQTVSPVLGTDKKRYTESFFLHAKLGDNPHCKNPPPLQKIEFGIHLRAKIEIKIIFLS